MKRIARQIEKNNPVLQIWYAEQLAWEFDEAGKAFKVSPRLLAAIAMQESGYVLDAEQCNRIGTRISCDFCMMQINDKTAERYGFEPARLMKEEFYCIDAGARVLSDLKKRYGKLEKDFWSRFNAVSPEKRDVYKKLVERWM